MILEFVGSEKELEREAFRMASGEKLGWKVARDKRLPERLLEVLQHWLEAQEMG